MVLTNAKAKEVLELCLASEPPQMRSRVEEIIHLSGLDPSDPMFLVLALTGQIKVFLEAAPAELRQLLLDWKQQNAASLAEIYRLAAEIKDASNYQIEDFKQSLSHVSEEYISQIKAAGMGTVSAIAEANSETLERVQGLQAETKSLSQNLETDRQKYHQSITSLTEQFQHITREFKQANLQLKSSIYEAKKFQQQASWSRRTEWFTPLIALAIAGIAGTVVGGWLTSRFYNSSTQTLGRKITENNLEQIIFCVNQNQSQCLIDIKSITTN